MPERDGYAPGTPSWVDLATPDVDDADALLRRAVRLGRPRTAGDARGDRRLPSSSCPAASGWRASARSCSEGQPPIWSTYFATDDVDALAERVTEFGGTVVLRADGRHGRRPDGVLRPSRRRARSAAGRPASTRARELVNEPVSLAWNTLITPRRARTRRRSSALVFGLRTETQDFGGGDVHDPHARRATASPG